ncbi:hypothetical protein [Pasteuria penetrans]|uniref:hypothetical protein n=1 Tax=Pasteuria penetrans TaxID=86005 RepID=UPI000FBF944D|nr:hypothetical protein [Pasteuria penetrans]
MYNKLNKKNKQTNYGGKWVPPNSSLQSRIGKKPPKDIPGPKLGRVSRSRSRDEGCSALRNRLIGSRLQTA